jgi:hypothetical protein
MKRRMIFVKSFGFMKIKIMRVPYDFKKTNYLSDEKIVIYYKRVPSFCL